MARIHIKDLPVAENLSPEERERLFGAGRASFRPSIESLEGREMYAVNLGSALTPTLLTSMRAAWSAELAQPHTPVDEIRVEGLGAAPASPGSSQHAIPSHALDAALWGGAASASAAQTEGENDGTKVHGE